MSEKKITPTHFVTHMFDVFLSVVVYFLTFLDDLDAYHSGQSGRSTTQ